MSPLPIIVVDLDGTLLRGDTLFEGLVDVARNLLRAPSRAWRVVRAIPGGKVAIKLAVAEGSAIGPDAFVYCEEVVQWLRDRRLEGHQLVLASGAPQSIAAAIADHIGLFDAVIGTAANVNNTGHRKRQALDDRFGPGGWEYVGNGSDDLAVWAGARRCWGANIPERVRRSADAQGLDLRVITTDATGRLRPWLREIRPHQWAKNTLLFLPLLLAHHPGFVQQLPAAGLGFIAFSLVASAVYVLNDLLDLPHDRSHPTKRSRPLAAGSMSVRAAFITVPILLLIGFAITIALPRDFGLVLAGYFALTLWYSLSLKRKPIVDVMTLAALYSIRLFAGSVATDVVLSNWLLPFAVFLFLSLALAKRASELTLLPADVRRPSGREYARDDLEPITALGLAAGCTAVLVLALYLSSDTVGRYYRHPDLLIGVCPLLLYWLARLWLYVRRGWVNEDPIVYALTDRTSRLIGLAALALAVLASVL